jgi:hypothetical protein
MSPGPRRTGHAIALAREMRRGLLGYLTGVSCVPTAEEFADGPEVTRVSKTSAHALARARRAHTRFGSQDRLAASSREETHWL